VLQGAVVLARSRRMGLEYDILRTLWVYLQPLWCNRPAKLSNMLAGFILNTHKNCIGRRWEGRMVHACLH